jgi:hypothetical protein
MAIQKPDAGQFDDVEFLIFDALAAVAESSGKGNGWPNFRLSEGGNTEKRRYRDT